MTQKPETRTLAEVKWRAVRFQYNEPHEQPMSHVERYDGEAWVRVTLHMPDAEAEGIVRAMNRAEALEALCEAAAESSLALDAARPVGIGWGRVNTTQAVLRAALRRVREA